MERMPTKKQEGQHPAVDRQQAWDRLFALIDEIHSHVPPDRDPETEERRIAREIKRYRREAQEAASGGECRV